MSFESFCNTVKSDAKSVENSGYHALSKSHLLEAAAAIAVIGLTVATKGKLSSLTKIANASETAFIDFESKLSTIGKFVERTKSGSSMLAETANETENIRPVSMFIQKRMVARSTEPAAGIKPIIDDARKAYDAQDWPAVRRLYKNVVEATAGDRSAFWDNYAATGRLGLAHLNLGELKDAEYGFTKFLSMDQETSPLRGKVFAGLADVYERTGRGARSGLLRARSLGNLTERPDFSHLTEPLKVPADYDFTQEASDQAAMLYEEERLKGPLTKGFIDFGQPVYLGQLYDRLEYPLMSVVDRTEDPALRSTLDKVDSVFGSLKPKPAEFSAALTEYTARIFKGDNLEHHYNEFRYTNVGEQYFLGEFLRRGWGMCNQRALFLKAAADEAKLESTLYRCRVTKKLVDRPEAHDFTTILINGKERVYDAGVRIVGERFSRHRGTSYVPQTMRNDWEP